jgi:hypothetical protein
VSSQAKIDAAVTMNSTDAVVSTGSKGAFANVRNVFVPSGPARERAPTRLAPWLLRWA